MIRGSADRHLTLRHLVLAVLLALGVASSATALLAAGMARSAPEAEPNLAVRIEGPASAAPGGRVALALVLDNLGDEAAPNSRVTLTLAAPLIVLDPGGGTIVAQGQLVWSLGSLAAGANRRLNVVARLPASATSGTAAAITALARSSAEEPDLGDNQALLSLRINPTDLRVSIGSSATSLRPGELVTHTVSILNVSQQAAEDLVVTVKTRGAAWRGDSATLTAIGLLRTVLPDGVRWTRASVPGPWTAHVDLVTRVPREAPAGSTVQHEVILTASTRDAGSADDRALSPLLTVFRPDLYVRSSGPDRVAPDDGMEFTLTYGNRGPGPVPSSFVTHTLPVGMRFVSASPAATRLGDRTLTWNRGKLQAGADDIIRIQTRLDGSLPAGTVLTSTTAANSAAPDGDPGDNRVDFVTRVVPGRPATLRLSGGSPLPVDDGRTEIRAELEDAFGNKVADGIELSFEATGGQVEPAKSLTAGGLATSTYRAGSLPGSFAITARTAALSQRFDLQLEPADLGLQTGLVGPIGPEGVTQFLPGGPLTYTLSLHNAGLARARGIVLATAQEERFRLNEVVASRVVTEVAELPAGLLDPPPGPYSARAWRLPDLSAGERITLSLAARLAPDPARPWTGFDPIFFRGAVTTTTAERSRLDLVQNQKIDVKAADLYTGISLNGLASSIRPGGQLVYDLSYGNGEAAAVAGALVTVTMPISTSFDHWMLVAGAEMEPLASSFAEGSRQLVWAVQGVMPRTGALRLWLDIDPEAPSEQLLQAGIEAGSQIYDVAPLNNRSADSGAWLQGVNLRTRLRGAEAVAPGEVLSWIIDLENAAIRDSASDITLRARLPLGLSYLQSSPTASVQGDGSLRWSLEQPLAAGASRVFELSAFVSESLLPGQALELEVMATSLERESYADDNTARFQTQVVPGPPASLELSLESDSLQVCGKAQTLASARLQDAFGNAVADGTVVAWSSTAGKLSRASSPSHSGVATVTLEAGRLAGAAQVRASAGGAEAERALTLLPGPPGALSVSADPAIVPNAGASSVTVQVRDACNNPVAEGWPILMDAERGLWSNGERLMTLPATGSQVRARLQVGTVAGPLRVSASHQSVTGQTQLSVNPKPPRWEIHLPLVGLGVEMREGG